VRARAPALECSRPNASDVAAAAAAAATAERAWAGRAAALRTAVVRQQLFFPDRRLMQYDCGKLQASLRTSLKQAGRLADAIFWDMSVSKTKQRHNGMFARIPSSSNEMPPGRTRGLQRAELLSCLITLEP
jgi:hypothetical protein